MESTEKFYLVLIVALVILGLFYMAIVGHIGFSFYYSFGLLTRIAFGVTAAIIVLAVIIGIDKS